MKFDDVIDEFFEFVDLFIYGLECICFNYMIGFDDFEIEFDL